MRNPSDHKSTLDAMTELDAGRGIERELIDPESRRPAEAAE
jgi:hypothetical protein